MPAPINFDFAQVLHGKRFWRLLFATCLVLVGLDLFDHKHSHFGIESWFGFYGFFGFGACLVTVVVSYLLRAFARREEDYYDE